MFHYGNWCKKTWSVILITLVIMVLGMTTAQAQPQPRPQCWPSVRGDFSIMVYAPNIFAVRSNLIAAKASAAGLTWGYLCSTPAGQFRYVFSGLWADYSPDWAVGAQRLRNGTKADWEAAWDKYTTTAPIPPELAQDVKDVTGMLPFVNLK